MHMDDSRHPLQIVGHPVEGPPGRTGPQEPVLCDFVPLHLVLEGGTLAIELTAPDLVLGRHTGADIRLPLPDVSRRHCRFVYAGGHWQVIDLQSLNGVWVNEQPVQRAPLYPGDRLRIGAFAFTVDPQAATEAADPAQPSLYDLFRATNARPRPNPQPRRLAG
jgi:predicted component of type VI protein secretion system